MDGRGNSEVLDEDELLQLAMLQKMKKASPATPDAVFTCENCGDLNAKVPCANKCMEVFYCSPVSAWCDSDFHFAHLKDI